MDTISFSALYDDAIKALDDNRLFDALESLRGLSNGVGNWQYIDDVNNLKRSYNLLLDYMSKGNVDPCRDQMYEGFFRQAYELTDKLHRSYNVVSSSKIYFSTLRMVQNTQQCFDTILNALEDNALQFSERKSNFESIEKQHTNLYSQLFNWVWTSSLWKDSDLKSANEMMKSLVHRNVDKCLFLSAVMLSCMQYFDVRKLQLLLSYAFNDDVLIAARALVGGCLVFQKFEKRLRIYPELLAQFDLLSENDVFPVTLLNLQTSLIMTLETKSIEKKMREDIIPSMMKERSNLNSKFGLDGFIGDFDSAVNPEWENSETAQKIEQKFRELAELQQKGADVYMGTFSLLKQRFPFFQTAANWFCPFYETHSVIENTSVKSSFMQTFLSATQLCDSDKYSFVLMMSTIPASQMDMMKSQFDPLTAQSDAINEVKKETRESACRLYIQSLYRFFQLFRLRSDFQDPFKGNIILTDNQYLAKYVTNKPALIELSELSFSQGNYLLALDFYKIMSENFGASTKLFQKEGYCYQQLKQYNEAIISYEKSLLLDSDSQWTIKNVAQCCLFVGLYDKALTYFMQLEKQEPNNLNLLFRLSECFIRLQRYDDAFPRLFKINYLANESEKANRAIAWCSFISGKLEQAEKYYEKILAHNANSSDYFNAGHVAWALGYVEKAISFYLESISLSDSKKVESTFFDDDKQYLERYSIKQNDRQIMLDALAYRSNM